MRGSQVVGMPKPKPKPKGGKPDAPTKMSSVDEADPRFKSISFDPRFARFPRRDKAKVKVDARFASMLDGSNDDFKVGASKDKRGRKHAKKKDDVSRLFRLDDDKEGDKEGDNEGDKEGDKSGNQRGAGAVSSSSSDDDEPILDENARRALRMRGLASDESSSEPSDSDESDVDNELAEGVLDEDLERLVEDWGVGAYAANPNEAVPMLEDSTTRLACMDMDWENVKAVDILAVLRSFVPEGGRIESVSVYPSDYGLERMEEEKLAGPKQIYKKKSGGGDNDGADNGDEDDDEEEDDDESDGAVDESRLRYYERSKLRWYYAIVVCSNVRTAEAIYTECDGMEFMKTANVIDLRFVPEGQSFEDRKVRDAATELPDDYVAPVFQTKALQHTNVELTWDKVDGDRKKTLSRKLNADDLKDEDFKTYLASASEDEAEDDDLAPEEDQDAVRERYQRLLETGGAAADQRKGKRDWGAGAGGSDGEGGDAGDDNDGDDGGEGKNGENGVLGCVADKNMELQVTFEQDLEALGEKLSTKAKEKKRGKGAETVWEAYERRRKEKREEAKRKGRVNYHSSDDDYEDDFDSDVEREAQEPVSPKTTKGGKAVDPFDDPFFSSNDTFKDPAALDAAGKKKKKKKRGRDEDGGGGEEDARERQNRQAELEMLLMDDAVTGKRGKQKADPTSNQTKKISKRERMKLAKLKKRAEREDGSDNEDLEAADREYLDMKDPRFQEVFDNPVFALDPTDPRYAKAGKGASKLATEAARRRSKTKSGSSKARPTEPIGLSGSTVPAVPAIPADPNRLAGANGKELKAMVANLKRKSAAAAGRKGGGRGSGKRKF